MGNYERKKSQPCQGCMNALKWIPVLFITAVIVWSYYAYIVQLCFLAIDNIFERIIFIIFYHIIFILFLWSYWSTIFTPTGVVPANWRIPESEVERIFRSDNQENSKRILEHCAKGLPITNRTPNGSVRFCEKCKIIKPDRAHHCSVCGACVLKMDHHCPWVNNCVNFTNYKFFVLFLGYALLYCLYVALTTLEYFIRFWRSEFVQQNELNGGMGRFHILFLFFVSLMFAISLVSLFGYHIYLTLMNRTTLEAFRAPIFRVGGPDKNGFNLGKYANFQEVFGDNWKLWFLPVYTSLGDGLKYPINPDKPQLQVMYPTTNYESMGSTDTRLDVVQPSTKLLNPHERQEQNLHLHQQNHHDHAGVDGRRIAGSGDHGRDTVDAAKSNARLPPINEINFSHNNGNVVVIDMNNISTSTSTSTASVSGRGPLTKDATTSPLDKENGMAMLTIDLENQTHNVART